MRRFWPKGLAGRLVLLLVSTLAIAQGVVVLVVYDEQKGIAGTMVHGQALNQTVTLARLLASHPPSEADRLTAAFGSRTTCAVVLPTASLSDVPPLDLAERELTEVLRRMLAGVTTGPARVVIGKPNLAHRPCETTGPGDGVGSGGLTGRHHGIVFAADTIVPLGDGRTLIFRMISEVPPFLTFVAAVSFLLSAGAVVTVVVVAVRWHTRALRELVSAVERLGRGEEVPRLAECGPIEIATAVHAFNTMQERLRRWVGDRMRLLAAVSHDLRTPLTTLRLKAEFIDEDFTREGIVSTIDELIAITEATLAFSRTEGLKEDTRTVDLRELIGELVEEFRLNDADVTLASGSPLPYACRPVSLKRAVRNLVENAVRYGDAARISLSCRDGAAVVDVDDDGPGLPEALMEEAFKPFVRLEPSRSHETGGIGLGLSIARGIVQGHGGSIVLSNRQGGGLTATILLPKPNGDA